MLKAVKTYASTARQQGSPMTAFALLVFFLTLADTTGMYIVPLLLAQQGFSTTMLGVIIGFSSIAGALFDFVVFLFFRNTNFRRLLLLVFALCLAYPLVLRYSGTIWIFLFAMAVWGVYFDLFNISMFDFVSRYTKRRAHAAGFGEIQVVRSLANVVAPLVVGLLLVDAFIWKPFELYWIYLAIAFLFFMILVIRTRDVHHRQARVRRKHFFVAFRIWKKVLKFFLPVLLLTIFLFIIDAFFWTLGPLYAQQIGDGVGSFFLTVYTLPLLIMGWLIGSITSRFGSTRVAHICLLIGSLLLSCFVFVSPGIWILGLVFLMSLCTSVAFPAVNALYADYIAREPYQEGEVEAMEDFSANIGYVAGPILAGYLADQVGLAGAFSLAGVGGVLLALALIYTKHWRTGAH